MVQLDVLPDRPPACIIHGTVMETYRGKNQPKSLQAPPWMRHSEKGHRCRADLTSDSRSVQGSRVVYQMRTFFDAGKPAAFYRVVRTAGLRPQRTPSGPRTRQCCRAACRCGPPGTPTYR